MRRFLELAWWIRRLSPDEREAFARSHRRRAFRWTFIAYTAIAATASALFLSSVATGLAILPNVIPGASAIFFISLWIVPVTFALLGARAERHYLAIIAVALSGTMAVVAGYAAALPSVPAADVTTVLQRVHIRAVISFFFVSVLLRLPYRFALVFSTLSFAVVGWFMSVHGGQMGLAMTAAIAVIIVLGLFTTWTLEDQQIQTFLDLARDRERLREIEHSNARLLEATRELQTAKDELEVTHRRFRDMQELARQQLEQRVRDAELSEAAKTRFLARASHDLRQPMSALQNFIEVAHHWHTAGNRREVDHVLKRMSVAVSVLSGTFNQILDISKYESGAVRPDPRPIDLGAILHDVHGQFSVLAEEKGIELRVRAPRRGPVVVLSDYDMLWRILINLVGNAIKFTPARPGRRAGVVLGATPMGDRARIDVWDTGIGVPRRFLGEIWEPFFQVGNAERNRERGLGLGLAIVRAAAESLGHHVSFRSIEGRGSRFSIELPICRDAPDSTVEQDASDGGRDAIRGSLVYLLEDDVQARESEEALLATWGAECVTGTNLAQLGASQPAVARLPDVIVTDFHLANGETGPDAVSRIRERFGRCVPALILTGDVSVPRGEVAALSNARILHKPVSPSRLRRAMNALMQEVAQPAPNPGGAAS